MQDLHQALYGMGVIPVIVINDVKDALPLGRALSEGGMPCAEVTFRTACAKEAIAVMARELPEMLIGAGTVLTTEQVDQALEAGAKFIVSPGLNPAVVKHCQTRGVPIIPGIATPSEVEQALSLGLEVVKFFPAEQSGGIDKIKAMSAPYPNVRFMPTGGVNAKNINQYLALPCVLACGGSWMAPADKIAAGDWEGITALARQAVQTVLGYDVVHVGVNTGGWDESEKVAGEFAALFDVGTRKVAKGFFAGSLVEVMAVGPRGAHGHIGVGVNHFDRAVAHLECKGYQLKEETIRVDEKGRRIFAYLTTEIGGFAVHLSQK